jgi:D-amino peptidase
MILLSANRARMKEVSWDTRPVPDTAQWRRTLQALAAIALLTGAGTAIAAEASVHGYRIFLSVDMEGIAGAVSSKQISNDGLDYQQSRRVMTDELLAAIDGARKGGATEFVVTDGHGDSQNLLIDALPPDVRLIRGTPLPLQMMEGIQESKFDGAIFLGYHASASSVRGVRAHTFSSARISEIKVNQLPASEGYFNAGIAGDFGVPVLMVTGDQATVDELRPHLKGAEMVAVKREIGYQSADVVPPIRAQQLIREAATRAVHRIATVTPLKITHPVTVDVTFHFYRPAELLGWLPEVQRTGGRSIRYQSKDLATAMRFLSFILNYNVTLEP